MFRRPCAAVLAALILTFASACNGSGLFGRQYEYEEDLTLGLDGRATVVVNASLASLAALRGLPVPVDKITRLKPYARGRIFANGRRLAAGPRGDDDNDDNNAA